MATYPAHGQLLGSTCEVLDDLRLDAASDGSARGRAFYTAPKRRLLLKHVVTKADAAALIAFYAANRTAAVDVTWEGDSVTYSCHFAAPPRCQPIGGGLWSAESDLREA